MIRKLPLIAFACLLISARGALADDADAKAREAEAKAIVAHRAKAAAVRAEAQAKADNAAGRGKAAPNAAGGLLDQVIAQFRPAAAPPPARIPAAAVEIRHEFVQQEIMDGAGRVEVRAVAVPVAVDAFPAAPLAAGAQPVDKDGLNAAEQQMLAQMFQPLLDRELPFVQKSCGLDDAQFQSVTDASKSEIKAAVRDFMKSQQQPRRVVQVNGVRRIEPAQLSPNKLIEDCLLKSVTKAKLPEEKTKLFNQELAHRKEFRKQAGVEAFVASIDERLFLDSTQREKLTEVLTKNWDENWQPYVDSLLYNSHLNPPIPNGILLPLLRQDQKDAWQAATQPNAVQMNGGIFFAPQLR